MHLVCFTFVDVMTSQSVMSVDGEEIPGKALEKKKMMLESLPKSRKSGNG